MVKIEKNIPVPKLYNFSLSSIDVWDKMEVGDSFLFEGKLQSISSHVYNAGKRFKRKFICRTVEGGVRVWRVE